jgi:beta-lactamase regulating signal transducer with metallopeptidase domain
MTLAPHITAYGVGILLDAAAKGVLLLAMVGLTVCLLRWASAATRHMVWLMGLFGLLLLPALSVVLPAWQIPLLPQPKITAAAAKPFVETPGPAPLPSAVNRRTPEIVSEPVKAQASPLRSPAALAEAMPAFHANPPMHWSAWVLLVWSAGAAVAGLSVAAGVAGIVLLTRRANFVHSGPLVHLRDQLCREMGLTRSVALFESPSGGEPAMPMTWGCLRPAILLPAGARDWPADRARVVLLHELAHVRRKDCLTQLLARVVCALYWFNPLAWLAMYCLRVERERACDDRVLSAGLPAGDYAGHLLDIVRMLRVRPSAALAAVPMARTSRIEQRLRAILDTRQNRRAVTPALLISAILILGSIVLPLSAVHPAAKAKSVELPSPVPAQAGRITLKNGVTVELIGVSYHPSRGTPWWRPDGSGPIDPPYDTTGAYCRPTRDFPVLRELAVRVSGVPKAGIGLSFPGGTQGHPFKDGKQVPDLWYLIRNERITDNISVSVGVAAGPWTRYAETDNNGKRTVSEGGSLKWGTFMGVTFDVAQQAGKDVVLPVMYKATEPVDVRFVAKDRTGNMHAGQYVAGMTLDGVHTDRIKFADVSLSDINTFEFQVRRYEWVEFKNVSLKPGYSMAWPGRAVDPAGKPVAGLKVRMVPDGPTVETDAAGRFAFKDWSIGGADPKFPLLSFLVHEPDRDRSGFVRAIEGREQVLRIGPGVTLSGHVVNADGRGIAGTTVNTQIETGCFTSVVGKDVTTDTEGRFQVKALPAATYYFLAGPVEGKYGSRKLAIDGAANRVETRIILAGREVVPELVCLSWQSGPRADQWEYWNPEGNPVDPAAVHLPQSLRGLRKFRSDVRQPLSAYIRCAGPVKEVTLSATLYGDDGRFTGSDFGTLRDGEWISLALAPAKSQAWPREITMDVTFPVENWRTLATVHPADALPVTVDKGVTWSIDRDEQGNVRVKLTFKQDPEPAAEYRQVVLGRDGKNLSSAIVTGSVHLEDKGGISRADHYKVPITDIAAVQIQKRERQINRITHVQLKPPPRQVHGSKLEFRIVPTALPPEDAARYKADLAAHGPAEGRNRHDRFQWFPVKGEVHPGLIAEYHGSKYILLCDEPSKVLVRRDSEPAAWALKQIYAAKGKKGEFVIGFEFDDRGAARFGDLTANNIGCPLAMLVDDQVVSASVIQSKITKQGIIDGRFTVKEVADMVGHLCAGMVPPPASP